MIANWSAVGGQYVSAYVKGGIQSGDLHVGHSSPGGSSTGPAVGVSAGFAPPSIGNETSDSLIELALRATLFTMKPTIGLISQEGICSISHTFDPAGPMTESAYEMAVTLDILSEQKQSGSSGSFTEYLNAGWENIRIGTLPLKERRKSSSACEPNPKAIKQQDEETLGVPKDLLGRQALCFQCKSISALIKIFSSHPRISSWIPRKNITNAIDTCEKQPEIMVWTRH